MPATTALWICQHCPAQHKSYLDFKRHMARHRKAFSGLAGLECPLCGFTVTDKNNLRSHLNTHTKPLICSLCLRRFARKSGLETHLLKHAQWWKPRCAAPGCQSTAEAQPPPVMPAPCCCGVICPVCGKFLRHKGSLRLHLKIHDPHKDYKCAFCHRKFTQKVNCETHLTQHTGVRHYRCEQGCCERAFATRQAQSAHRKAYLRRTGGVRA
eukprot:g80768.t1